MKKVLVSGAGGFIGSHLVERLVAEGYKVKAFIRYNSRNDWANLEFLSKDILNKVEIFQGDIRDSDAVKEAVRGCSEIFHLAAVISIPYSYLHPLEFVQTNVIGTLNLLNAAKELKIEKFIHTSTSEVYGTAQYVPIDEKHPLTAQSPYSATKIAADKLAESYYLSFGLPVIIIRPFNTYGPRQSARAIIPTIITQALTRNKIVLGSLHPVRDINFVSDIVEAFIKISKVNDAVGQIVNIGTGKGYSVKEIIELIQQIIGYKVKIVIDHKRIRPEDSEVKKLIADNKKARTLLKWNPMVSTYEGLTQTVNWIKQNINRYKAELYNI